MHRNAKIGKIELVKRFMKLPNRKPIWQVLCECVYLTITYRSLPNHYFGRYLFIKGVTNITDYLPAKILQKIKAFFNDHSVAEVLENKLYFNFFYALPNIPLPKILMYNHRDMFVIDCKPYKITTSNEFVNILAQLMKTKSLDSLFIKGTYDCYGGENIYKLFANQLVTEQPKVKALFSEIVKTGYLFQETIEQHPVMNILNPSCLNTIRMDTFTDSKGVSEIMSAYLRISIDNEMWIKTEGGAITIDLNTGKLLSDCYSGFRYDVGEPLKEHPVTKVQFNTFTVPFFDQIKEMVINSASLMPGLRIIGWDIGIGESGPILIEGNTDYDITWNDYAIGGYLSSPVFMKAWKEFNKK